MSRAVYILDDDPGTLDSMSELLSSVSIEHKLFSSPEDFLSRFDPNQAGCALIDIRMREKSGFEVLEHLTGTHKYVPPVIMVTAYADTGVGIRAVRSRVFDLIEKPYNGTQLIESINRALRFDADSRRQRGSSIDECDLTGAERKVFDHLINGLSPKEIAAKLRISIQTVSKHRTKILKKCAVKNEVQLALKFRR